MLDTNFVRELAMPSAVWLTQCAVNFSSNSKTREKVSVNFYIFVISGLRTHTSMT
jgi:hypothetical protein